TIRCDVSRGYSPMDLPASKLWRLLNGSAEGEESQRDASDSFQRCAKTSRIRPSPSAIVSRDAAYEIRRCPSPASPNALPGVTATDASFRIRSLRVALSTFASYRGKT